MKLASKIKKHISRRTKSARKAASYAKDRAKALVGRRSISALLALLAAAGIIVYSINRLETKLYTKGCVDGAAISMASLVPFAAGEIIQSRNDTFGEICGKLGQLNAKGKSLDDLLK